MQGIVKLCCKGRIAFGWLVILGLWAVAATGAAAEATVSGTGEEMLRPVPTMFRVRGELSSQAGTVEMALARLQERRKAAAVKLKTIGANADSIAFDHPIVTKISPFGQPPTIQPIRELYSPYSESVPISSAPSYAPSSSTYMAPVPAPPPRPSRTLKVPPLYRASMTFSVDWPLAAENMDQVLVAAEALKKRIAAADVTGVKQPDQLTPEEQEILEEATVRPSTYETTLTQPMVGPRVIHGPYASPQVAQNGLQFLFVARVSPEQRKAALARAFAKAKTQAGEMADAAGRDLGPLLSLDGRFQHRVGSGYGVHAYPVAASPIYQSPAPSPDADESAASDPRSIAFRAEVHATFRLP